MTIRFIQRQPVGMKKSLDDMERLYMNATKLVPIDSNGISDCLEVDINPEDIRHYGKQYGFIIRRVDSAIWRIWRKH